MEDNKKHNFVLLLLRTCRYFGASETQRAKSSFSEEPAHIDVRHGRNPSKTRQRELQQQQPRMQCSHKLHMSTGAIMKICQYAHCVLNKLTPAPPKHGCQNVLWETEEVEFVSSESKLFQTSSLSDSSHLYLTVEVIFTFMDTLQSRLCVTAVRSEHLDLPHHSHINLI